MVPVFKNVKRGPWLERTILIVFFFFLVKNLKMGLLITSKNMAFLQLPLSSPVFSFNNKYFGSCI